VKKNTAATVDRPSIDPITGPAIQLRLRGWFMVVFCGGGDADVADDEGATAAGVMDEIADVVKGR
jgi:hypothetical protein